MRKRTKPACLEALANDGVLRTYSDGGLVTTGPGEIVATLCAIFRRHTTLHLYYGTYYGGRGPQPQIRISPGTPKEDSHNVNGEHLGQFPKDEAIELFMSYARML